MQDHQRHAYTHRALSKWSLSKYLSFDVSSPHEWHDNMSRIIELANISIYLTIYLAVYMGIPSFSFCSACYYCCYKTNMVIYYLLGGLIDHLKAINNKGARVQIGVIITLQCQFAAVVVVSSYLWHALLLQATHDYGFDLNDSLNGKCTCTTEQISSNNYSYLTWLLQLGSSIKCARYPPDIDIFCLYTSCSFLSLGRRVPTFPL